MSAKDRRIDRLSEGLTARERVVLMQQAMYEGREPDPIIRRSMPKEQQSEFNHYAELANRTRVVLIPRTLLLYQEVQLLELRWLLLLTLLGWAFDHSSILLDASLVSHVPIDQAGYEARREELSRDRFSVSDAAEFMLIDEEDDSKRAQGRVEKRLRAAIKSGDLAAKRKGRGYEIEFGALCAWRGEAVEPFPDWGRGYELIPDGAVAFAGSADRLLAATESGPHHPNRIYPALSEHLQWLMGDDELSVHDRIGRALAAQLAADVPQWEREVTALNEVMAQVVEEFGDEEIIYPQCRGFVDAATRSLAAIREMAPKVVGVIDDPPPHEGLAEELAAQIFNPDVY